MAFDFSAVRAPFRMQPGLRRLGQGERQLTPQRLGDRALVAKLDVLKRWPHQAFVARDGFDPLPALHHLATHAALEHPQAWAWDGHRAAAPALGFAVDGDELHALSSDAPAAVGDCLASLAADWRLAGLLALAFAEDFAILDASDATIPWLAVCLPSHWAPERKVGRPFVEVHAPVADNALLLTAASHLVRLVTGDDRWERFVWTITPHAALQAHPDHRGTGDHWPPPGSPAADWIDRAQWRTEHQTFVPVLSLGQAVFTIHVELTPLAVAIDTPDRAALVHAALASMSTAVLAYRGLTPARAPLLDWLAVRSRT